MKWQDITKWTIVSIVTMIFIGSITLNIISDEFSIMLKDGTLKAKYSEGILKVYSGRYVAFEDYLNLYYWNGDGYITMYKDRGDKYSNLSYHQENDTTYLKQDIYYSQGTLTRYFEITEYKIKESFEWFPNNNETKVYFTWTYGKLDEFAEKQVYLDKNLKTDETMMDFNITNNWGREIDNIVRVERFQNGKLKIRTKVFKGSVTFDPEIILKDKEKPKEIIEWKNNCQTRCINGKCNQIIGRTNWVNDSDNTCKQTDKAQSLKNSPIKAVVTKDSKEDADIEIIDYNLTSVTFKPKEKDIIDSEIRVIKKEYNITSEKINYIEKSKLSNVFISKESDYTINVNFENGEEVHIGENSTTIILNDTSSEVLADVSAYLGYPNWGVALIKFNISSIPSGNSIDSALLYLYLEYVGNTFDNDVIIKRITNQTWDESICDGETCSPLQNFELTNETNKNFSSITLHTSTYIEVDAQFQTDYDLSNDYVSIYLEDPDLPFNMSNCYDLDEDWGLFGIGDLGEEVNTYCFFNDREKYWSGNHSPYLNVTYSDIISDTCTCPGDTTNHTIDCSDYCNITSCTAGHISFNGTGETLCNGTWDITGRDEPPNACTLNIGSECHIT